LITASSKSKKAQWRKWADQKLDPLKPASSSPDAVTTAALPDARQLPKSEIAESPSLKGMDAPVDVEAVQVTARMNQWTCPTDMTVSSHT
jgi:hypothetical protein